MKSFLLLVLLRRFFFLNIRCLVDVFLDIINARVLPAHKAYLRKNKFFDTEFNYGVGTSYSWRELHELGVLNKLPNEYFSGLLNWRLANWARVMRGEAFLRYSLNCFINFELLWYKIYNLWHIFGSLFNLLHDLRYIHTFIFFKKHLLDNSASGDRVPITLNPTLISVPENRAGYLFGWWG